MTAAYYKKKINHLEKKNKKLRKTLQKINYEVVYLLQNMFSVMNGYTGSHSERVAHYAVIIAKNLKELAPDAISVDMMNFHDLGKIGVPQEILLKPSKLTDEEYLKIQKHTLIGSQIVSKIKAFQNSIDVIKFHHERWDGKGYPVGLKEEEIPVSARILAVADAFDAMTTDRPYRKKKPVKEAKREILANSGTQFDPKVVDAFVKGWEEIEKKAKN